jgi:hypothetical protein
MEWVFLAGNAAASEDFYLGRAFAKLFAHAPANFSGAVCKAGIVLIDVVR